jgi:hypothetical protein
VRLGTVIVGASIGGARTAQALRSAGYQEKITLVGDETALPYGRPPLSEASYRVREPVGLGGANWWRCSWAWLSHPVLGELDLFLSGQASGLAPRCSASMRPRQP